MGGRLPLEVEWEHAALHSQLNPSDVEDEIVPAKSQADSTEGEIHHLLDNVLEWTETAFHTYPYQNPYEGPERWDGVASHIPETVAIRGGSFDLPANALRPTMRIQAKPTVIRPDLGFRCAYDE